MKKLYLILALFLFTGSYAVNTYAAVNDNAIELKDDDKNEIKKKKEKERLLRSKSKVLCVK
ncbi:MAG: hypothetical protein ACPG9I_00845 [Crocinitomicaceae bacterium]